MKESRSIRKIDNTLLLVILFLIVICSTYCQRSKESKEVEYVLLCSNCDYSERIPESKAKSMKPMSKEKPEFYLCPKCNEALACLYRPETQEPGNSGLTRSDKPSIKNRPAQLPADVPFYNGGEVVSESNFPLSAGKDFQLLLRAPDSYNNVYDYYKEELARNGWTIGSTAETAQLEVAQAVGLRLIASKKEVTIYLKIIALDAMTSKVEVDLQMRKKD
ncbi:hypothetical protein ACFLU6_01445 [Acidobacteriota bacterium]